MAFAWKEYFYLARFLAQVGANFTQEAVFRSAVSRAYYAAFCHARNYARDHYGFSPTHSPRDHGLVRTHLRNLGMADIARYLETLRQWRNRCDYDDSVSDVSGLLDAALIQAQQVIDGLA